MSIKNIRKQDLLERAIEELMSFRAAFKSTIGYQKYEVNVFECLNARYIEAGRIIDKFKDSKETISSCPDCSAVVEFDKDLGILRCTECEWEGVSQQNNG